MLTLILRSGVRLPAGAITYPSPNSSSSDGSLTSYQNEALAIRLGVMR